jgi:hypothetical protein
MWTENWQGELNEITAETNPGLLVEQIREQFTYEQNYTARKISITKTA